MPTTSTGYTPCRACDAPVIGEHLCCYCEEARMREGMHDVDDLTQRELAILSWIAFEDEAQVAPIAFEDEDQSVSA